MRNWRTTLVGCLGAALQCALDLIGSGTVEPKTLITAVALATLGALAKDFNVSGTQVP